LPGTPTLIHRLGGLEKEDRTGNVSYDPTNHEFMVKIREAKVEKVADFIPLQKIDSGVDEGDLLVLGWGSTYGVIKSAMADLLEEGHQVAHAHLRYIKPFPKNLGELMQRYKKVLIPEINNGQLCKVIRDKFLIPVEQFNKIQGVPITKIELKRAIKMCLAD
jgi:2-oxoglutarate ferredoxin oxidoreductase subunit alpha